MPQLSIRESEFANCAVFDAGIDFSVYSVANC
jgi:hypothetical protein